MIKGDDDLSFLEKTKGLIPKKFNVNPEILKIDTLIGKKTVIDGDITADGNCKADGTVNGEVKIEGDLIVGTSGRINGNIFADNIIIAGTVNGNINAKGMLCVKRTASVSGEHTAYSLIVDEGSVFKGNCSVLERDV